MYQMYPYTRKLQPGDDGPGPFDRLRVAVDANRGPSRREPGRDGSKVTRAAQGTVHKDLPGTQSEKFYYLF
jgi:hypothetical protein